MSASTIIISSVEEDRFILFPIEGPSDAHYELAQTQTDFDLEYLVNRIPELQ